MVFTGRELQIFSNQQEVFINFCKWFAACKTIEKSPKEKFQLFVSDSIVSSPEEIKRSSKEKNTDDDLLKMGILKRTKNKINKIWHEISNEQEPNKSSKIVLQFNNKVKVENLKDFISKISQTKSSNCEYTSTANKKSMKNSLPNENLFNFLNTNSGSKTPKSNSTCNNSVIYKRKAKNLSKFQIPDTNKINQAFFNNSGIQTTKHANIKNKGNKSMIDGLKFEKLKEKLNQNINILDLLNDLDKRDENESCNWDSITNQIHYFFK